jgi:hypothetical protein
LSREYFNGTKGYHQTERIFLIFEQLNECLGVR